MAKKKTTAEISKSVGDAIELAKEGMLPRHCVTVSCGSGLNVVINNNTAAAKWCARIKGRMYMLGDFARMDYKNARAKVDAMQAEIKAPPEFKAPKLSEIWIPFMEKKIKRLKSGSNRPNNYKTLYKKVLSPFHDIQIDKLTRAYIVECIDKLNTTEGNKHNGVGLLTMILDYAANRGFIENNPIQGLLSGSESPFPQPKETHRAAVLPDAFVSQVLIPLAGIEDYIRAFFLLLALSGLRFGECRLLRWQWIDREQKIIRIPPDAPGANKTKHDLIKPLTPPMIKVLAFMRAFQSEHPSDYVFQSVQVHRRCAPAGDNTLREKYRKLVGKIQDPHGFRSTIKTWIESQTVKDPATGLTRRVFDAEVAESALTHDIRTQLQKTYDLRSFVEPVRSALKAWNDFLVPQLPQPFKEILYYGDEFLKQAPFEKWDWIN